MKAIRVHQFGLDHPMKFEEVDDPKPGLSEVLIKTGASGVNPVELSFREGALPYRNFVKLPFIPGAEAAGEIVEVGEGVEGFEKGQRVCGRAVGGGYAELVRLDANATMALPDSFSFAEGAGVTVPFYTAWNALVIKAKATAGEAVLVQGGAGGVGMASIQMAKILGCRVFATVSSKEKADFCVSMGADAVINYREEAFAERCKELTGGRGVDVIVELSATDNFDKDLDAIAVDGRVILIGTGTGKGRESTFRVPMAMTRDARILGLSAVNLMPKYREMSRRMQPLLEAGRFRVSVDRETPLEAANAVQEVLLSAKFLGKLVLVP